MTYYTAYDNEHYDYLTLAFDSKYELEAELAESKITDYKIIELVPNKMYIL